MNTQSIGSMKLSTILPMLRLIAKSHSLDLSRVKEFKQAVKFYYSQNN